MVRRRRRRGPRQDRKTQRTPVVDIFDEVDEDLRAERAARLLKKFGWLIIVAAVAIVTAAAGWQLWDRRQTQQDAAIAARYVAVVNAIEQAPANAAAHAAQIAPLNR